MFFPRPSNRPSNNSIIRSLTLLAAIIFGLVAAGGAARAATITVPAGGNLQAALDQARPGDTIVLEAGASYVGSFMLPAKAAATGTDSDYITIRTSASDSSLPGPSERLDPALHSHLLARLLSPGQGMPVISTAPGAHHYRFLGIEFAPESASAQVSELIALGDGSSAQSTLSQVPHHLIIDRCYLHALAGQELKRGVSLQSGETSIINSYLEGFKSSEQDSQAMCGWNGPGPFHIVNNYVEAAGENIMFGGADASIQGLVPSDIEVRGNLITKPLSWKVDEPTYAGQKWVVKNLLELKNAQRVRIEGNTIENCWRAAQGGTAVVLTPRNQSGTAPWSAVREVVIMSNIIRHANQAIGTLSQDYEHTSQVLDAIEIKNNLVYDIQKQRWGAGQNGGYFVSFNGPGGKNITVSHNTALNNDTGILFEANVSLTNLVLTDNFFHYHILGDGAGGTKPLNDFVPGGWRAQSNAIVIDESHDFWVTVYPQDNFYPRSFSEVGFEDLANSDLRLTASSAYKGKATDGKDIGCDFDALEKAMNSSTPGTNPPPTSPALVSDAHDTALALANSTSYSATETAQLAANIEQAYSAFQAEAARFVSAEQIDVSLRAAYYFTSAATALINAGAPAASVQNRLQIAEVRLAQAASLMQQQQTNAVLAHALDATAMPVIGPADIRSAGSLAPTVSAGSLGLVFGDTSISPLASDTAAATQAADGSFPYELSGVSVTVGGFAAQVIAVSPSQVNFYIPADVPAGAAEVLVTSKDGKVSRGTTVIPATAPAIFTKDGSGAGAAVAFNAATYLSGDFDVTTDANFGADKRTRLTFFATGISAGVVNKNLTNDILGPAGTILNLAESVKVEARTKAGATLTLTVEYAGRQNTMPGLDQIVVILPAELKGAGEVQLTITAGGQRSNTATVFVK
jgi:uncharacterized protein (TIGR03437 family)